MLLASSLQAAGSGLSIVLFRVEPSNLFAWNQWAEGAATIKNESAEEQSFRIVLEMPGEGREGLKVVFGRYVTLAPMSQQEVRFMVRFPSSAVVVSTDPQPFPMKIRLMRNETILAEDKAYSLPLADVSTRILWCQEASNELGYHFQKRLRTKGEREISDARITMTQSRNLPYFLHGYSAYNGVVISSWDAAGLDAMQTESLLNWVRNGGHLLVIAGSHWFTRPNAALAEALPLWPDESYPISTLPEIEAWAGDLGIADGVRVYDGPRADARIVIGNEDQPILLSRPLGHGVVWILTLDVDRRLKLPTDGMNAFMGRVLALLVDGSAPPSGIVPQSSSNILGQLVAMKIVARETMALWLGIYLLAIVLALVAARLLKRNEWGYAVVLLVALANFAFLSVQSQRQRQASAGQIERARIYLASMKENDSNASLTAVEGFFPARLRTLDWSSSELTGFDTLAMPTSLTALGLGTPELVELQRRDTGGIAFWMLKPNTLRALGMISFARMPGEGSRFSTRLTSEGVRIEIQNGLPWKLEQPFFKWNRFVTCLPDLVPGKKTSIDTWKSPALLGKYQGGLVHGGAQEARNLLRQVLLPDPPTQQSVQARLQSLLQRSRRPPPRIALGGYTTEDPRFWKKPDSRATDTSLGLWLIQGQDSLLTADNEFWMPPGIAELELASKEGRVSYLGDGNFASPNEDNIQAFFRLPPCLQGVEIRELTLHGNFESLHFQPSIEVAFGTYSATPKEWIRLSWASQMRIPHDKAAFGNGIDGVWVKIGISRRAGVSRSADGIGTLGQHWILRGLDLSLRGKKTGPSL
jgi:hypothetical protein